MCRGSKTNCTGMDYGKSAARISYFLKVAVMFMNLILSTMCNWPPDSPTKDLSTKTLEGLRSAIKSLERERDELEEKKADVIEAKEDSASQLESLSSAYKSKARELEMCQNNAIDVSSSLCTFVMVPSWFSYPTLYGCNSFSKYQTTRSVRCSKINNVKFDAWNYTIPSKICEDTNHTTRPRSAPQN